MGFYLIQQNLTRLSKIEELRVSLCRRFLSPVVRRQTPHCLSRKKFLARSTHIQLFIPSDSRSASISATNRLSCAACSPLAFCPLYRPSPLSCSKRWALYWLRIPPGARPPGD